MGRCRHLKDSRQAVRLEGQVILFLDRAKSSPEITSGDVIAGVELGVTHLPYQLISWRIVAEINTSYGPLQARSSSECDSLLGGNLKV